jgi:undecaprenyl-diphosphatase|tara:strand:+ start:2171 stop:2926 length:756 start_codon:yes stop_codon:yes gene_type:complete
MLDIIFLSIIQGITEFLPVSSSAHLVLFSKYFNLNNGSLSLDMSLHLGSLLAILFYFKKDLLNFVNNKVLFSKIILSSIPVIIIGFLLIYFNLINYLRSYKVIGWATIFFGIVLYFSDKFKINRTIIKDFKYRYAFYIGLFQALSLIPGVSRSGITITAARFLNFNRVDSAKISFLISIPTLCAVSLYNLQDLIFKKNLELSLLNFLGIFLAFIFSYLTIKVFIQFVEKFSLLPFVIYRIILGFIIIIYAY